MIHMDSEEEALHTISVLAEGGTVLSPLSPHPEPDDENKRNILPVAMRSGEIYAFMGAYELI